MRMGVLRPRIFGSSKKLIDICSDEYEFRGTDKGYLAHNVILQHMWG
jgi:hypothetical protein